MVDKRHLFYFREQEVHPLMLKPGQTMMRRPLRKQAQKENGFTYIMVLLSVVVIGISLAAVGRYWSFVSQRDKEEELLFRGDQYVKAIDAYFRGAHGGANLYPKRLEDLIKDPASLKPKRYLRTLYRDPMTSKADWLLILEEKSGRIKGVKSRSSGVPVKTESFPAGYKDFSGKGSYSEWEFVHVPGKVK